MRLFIILSINWIWLMPCTFSQEKTTDCESLLRDAYHSVQLLGSEIPKGKTYYLDYAVEVNLRGEQNQASQEKVQAWYGPDFAIVKSPTMEIYQDQTDYFAISHREKQIVWTNSSGHLGQQARFQRFSTLQDSLLAHGKVHACTDVSWAGKQAKRIKWHCNSLGEKYLNVKSITYWIEADNHQLLKALIIYGERGNIESYELEIHQMNLNHQIPPERTPIKTAIFNAKGSLKKAYTSYTINDIRKQ